MGDCHRGQRRKKTKTNASIKGVNVGGKLQLGASLQDKHNVIRKAVVFCAVVSGAGSGAGRTLRTFWGYNLVEKLLQGPISQENPAPLGEDTHVGNLLLEAVPPGSSRFVVHQMIVKRIKAMCMCIEFI